MEEAYWVHKIDRLWKEVEELKKRVESLEKMLVSQKVSFRQETIPQVSAGPLAEEPAKETVQEKKQVVSPHIDPVLKVLREKGPLNIIDLNNALREEGIAESVRDTLFKRVKKLMEEGKVAFDEQSQTFYAR